MCLGLATIALLAGACAPGMLPGEPTRESARETTAGESIAEEPLQATATQAPEAEASEPTLKPEATIPVPTPTAIVEPRIVELEWPASMRYGDSDTVRLSLIPQREGYTVTAEFPEHQTELDDIEVARPEGYDLRAVARLDGVGFHITPSGERPSYLPVGKGITWRWTLRPEEVGRQTLSTTLLLRWIPREGNANQNREAIVYSRSMQVRVVSFFGLTRRQAMTGGLVGLIFGGGLSLYTLISFMRPTGEQTIEKKIHKVEVLAPNPNLSIERKSETNLSTQERELMQAVFRRYERVVLEREFPSGYSGARTFLALPIREDGRTDAYAVVKIDHWAKIQREHENYEKMVKHSLPPITARIQQPPVAVRPPRSNDQKLAALQYTFIAEPGRMPMSLREALLNSPDAQLVSKLFETIGPNWWMQRSPYTFKLAQEYDRMLPTHFVIAPASGKGMSLDGYRAADEMFYGVGEIVELRNFEQIERRADGRSLSLVGKASPGQPAVRVHWESLDNPNGAQGRITATRSTKLRASVTGFDLFDLPDPLVKLPDALNQKISGTRSTIHGDLNLENVLVGPGEMVWLIDFATTREGHTLYDFAHLKAEVIAHVIAPQIEAEREFLELLSLERRSSRKDLKVLLESIDRIATRCLFDPAKPREFHLAVYMACLGALKFENLSRHQKYYLYLAAAQLSRSI